MHSTQENDVLFQYAKKNDLFQYVKAIKNLFNPPVPPRRAPFFPFYTFELNEFDQLVYYPNKTEVPRPKISNRTVIAFLFGQSNSANHGGEKYQAANANVTNYWNGKFFVAADPLLGATGWSGSVWTITANKMLSKDIADQIILVPAGVGSSYVNDWKQGGRLNAMLEKRLIEARADNLPITHFLWHQGESDNPVLGGISLNEYEKGLTGIIQLTQKYFPNSKFFIALVSRCGALPFSLELQNVQRKMTKMENVYLGPNSDKIDLADRYDDCHFSGRGLERLSDAWVSAIKEGTK